MKLKKPKFWDSSRFSFWAILFFPISILFLLFSFINKYKISKKFPIPVICVGNIYVGGTGKFLGDCNFFIKENNKNNIEIGKNKITQKENFELSQNFGFFNFIYIYLLISF